MKKTDRKRTVRKICTIMCTSLIALTASVPTFAASFSSSVFAKGVKKLLNDILSWATPLVAIAGALFIVYFSVRRAQADESEKKRWESRIISAIVFTIIGTLASAFLNVFLGYFQ